MNIFFSNVESIKGIESLGITEFMDISPEEFAQTHLNPVEAEIPTIADLKEQIDTDLAETTVIDWVAKGAVTPVKNQGKCGGCWTFATTGGVEGANFVATNVLTSLSEQQLLDCDSGNDGCGGGLRNVALDYVKKNGLTTEEAYPYTGVAGKCQVSSKQPYGVKSYTNITTCSSLLSGVKQGVVTVGIDATQLQYYTGGILSDCGTSINHAVLLVGYNSIDASWKVKNSWGPAWGENGYFRLSAAITNNQIANTCSLCTRAYQPFSN